MTRVLALLLLLLTGPALAAPSPDEMLQDPVEEARARDLAKDLRCVVCQNQSIDDSDAALAKDLRRVVREQIAAGRSDPEIKGYLVARYGDFVLLDPPFKATTLLLWLGPFAVLALGGLLVVRTARRRASASDAPEPLTPDEERRLADLLGDGGR